MSWLSKAVGGVHLNTDDLTGALTGWTSPFIRRMTGMSGVQQLMTGASIGSGLGLVSGLRGGASPGVSPASGAGSGVMSAQGGSGFSVGSLLPSVFGTAGEIYSANQAAAGQREANQMSLESAREQMAFQADQVQQQENFQERMSDTSVQRRMADLRRAGINPVLAAGDGASTPVGASGSGAMASFGNPEPNYSGIASKAVNTALQVQQMQKDFESIDADIANKRKQNVLLSAQTDDTTASARQAAADASIREQEAQFYRDNPWAMKLRIGSQAIAPVAGAARDAALSFFGIKKGMAAGAPSSTEKFGPEGQHFWTITKN